MTWKEDIVRNLELLIDSVQNDKNSLGENVDKLEESENSRCQERKLILSNALKKVFATLNNVDKKMVAQIKTDAYDTTRQLDKVEREIKKLLVDVKKSDDGGEAGMKACVATLKSKYLNVDVNSLNAFCNVSLGYDSKALENVLHNAISTHSGLYIKNGAFDPNMFQVTAKNSKTKLSNKEYAYFCISSRLAKFSEAILKNMIVRVFAFKTPGEKYIPVFNTTISEMKKKNEIEVDGSNRIKLKFKRPSSIPEATMVIHVTIFNTALKGCPTFNVVSSDLDQTDFLNLTSSANPQLNGSICLGDLDEDDIRNPTFGFNSVMPLTAIQNQEFSPSLQSAMPIAVTKVMEQEASPSAPPIHNNSKATGRGAAREVPNLSDVREATGEADVTIFSPVSDRGMVSTMRPTSMAGRLDGALVEAQKSMEDRVDLEDRGDISLVSAMNGISVEDMQKSLSSNECSKEDDEAPEEMAVHNRSVSFAVKTRIIQDLATPQPGEIKARFRIDQGNTKVKDGKAGVVKRLIHQPNDVNEEHDDPHVNLNASKAPSLTLADQSLQCDPVWNTGSGAVHEWAPSPLKGDQSFATKVGMSDQSRINMSNWEQEEEYKRASLKADESFATKVGLSNKSRMDMSVWELDVQTPKDLTGFNLALGLVEQVDIYLPGDIGEGKGCMQSPVHVDYATNFTKFLISEPEYNRIGVYSKGTVSFQGWFGGRNNPYDYPTSILYLDNGFIAVLERSKINIYDKNAKLIQKIGGCYNGLAKAHEGDFVTSQKTEDMKTHIAVIGQVDGTGDYIIKEKVTISVIANKMKSKVRFLAVHGSKIYASDYGMNCIYVVDMRTRSQTSWGLEFKEPCSILVDDVGNILVADSGNNRLVVYNMDGEFVRKIGSNVKEVSTPSDMVKVRGKGKDGEEENHILVTYSGTDGTDGRLVRFKCM